VIFTSGCTGALKLIAESFIFETDCSSHGNTKGHNCEFINNQDRCNIPVIGKESELCDTTRHHTSTCSGTDFQDGGSLYADVKVRKGCFAYLLDNHTSVQGMREIIKDKVESILCIEEIAEQSFKEHLIHGNKDQHNNGNSLFVYPAQSNYCGRKYPLEWTKEIHEHQMTFQGSFPGRWFVLQDVASYASTSHLDLSIHKPDFVTLSFYKMFGFPTGLGKNQ
jgi:molybdenum cofactor sulfurtransferase